MCKSKSFILLCCHHHRIFALIPTLSLFHLSKFIVSCQISDKVNRDQIHTVEILGEWTFFLADFSSPFFLGPFNLARHSSIIYLFVGFETLKLSSKIASFFLPYKNVPNFSCPFLGNTQKKFQSPEQKKNSSKILPTDNRTTLLPSTQASTHTKHPIFILQSLCCCLYNGKIFPPSTVPPSVRAIPSSGQITARKGSSVTLECKGKHLTHK